MMDHDSWFEILVRVDPSTIFNCILVCKTCLEVITSLEFRQSYQKIWNWKSNSKLVGFIETSSRYSEFDVFATSKLGRMIHENKSSMQWRFVSPSGAGDGLILYGNLPDNLYVSKPGENPIQLPRLNKTYYLVTVVILSQHNSFKVILISGHDDYSDEIYTFSSSTGKWDDSKPRVKHGMKHHFPYGKGPAIVSSSRGLVYWPYHPSFGKICVGVYDDNNEEKPISWEGPYRLGYDYGSYVQSFGLSSKGYLLMGASHDSYGNEIDIWCFNDDDKSWNRLHSVRPHPIPKKFSFVSLIPRTSDVVVVKSAGRLFLYHHGIRRKLDTSTPLVVEEEEEEEWLYFRPSLYKVPLTMADLGVWPSSPLSKTQTNIGGIKHLSFLLN